MNTDFAGKQAGKSEHGDSLLIMQVFMTGFLSVFIRG
jgi:hypothetical protein